MKKILIAASVFAALSTPAFAEIGNGINEAVSPVSQAQIADVTDMGDSTDASTVLAQNAPIDYSTTQSVPEVIPFGLQLRNAEILYDRFNR